MANMYNAYSGKSKTDSNIAWHRPQSTGSRVEDELMEKSARALYSTTEPLERLRLMCLSRGACGILKLGRIFRKLDVDGNKDLNRDEFFTGIIKTGLNVDYEDAEKLFALFDTDNKGYISVDEFIRHVRPPMNDGRHAIVEQAFNKLDKTGDGIVSIQDLRDVYSVYANGRYKSGEETEEFILNKFLANFENDGMVDGKVTLEEFMNYYSGISVSIENDCFFNLVMRQAFKL